MLIRGCLRVVVAMLPNVSCVEGGMNTAAAIHMAVNLLPWSRGTGRGSNQQMLKSETRHATFLVEAGLG